MKPFLMGTEDDIIPLQEKPKPLFILDVNIGSRQNKIVVPLKIYQGDDHVMLVKLFAMENQLNE